MLLKKTIKRIWPWLYFKLYPSLAVLHAVTEAIKKVGEPEEVDSETFKKKVGLDAIRESWELFYKEYFKIKIDLSRVSFPQLPSMDNRLNSFPVIVIPGLSIEKIIKVMNSKKLKHGIFGGFSIEACDYLYKYKMLNEREATTEPYSVIFHSTDMGCGFHSSLELQCLEFMGRDLKSLYEEKIPFATLMEQLLFDLKYNVDKLRYLDHHFPGTMCLGTKIQAPGWYDKNELINHFPIINSHSVGLCDYTHTDEYGIFKIVV